MENIFIPENIARELKEKGFDKPCCSYWDVMFENKIRYEYASYADNWNRKFINERLSRPTHQQVIDWLREEKGIFIDVHVMYPTAYTFYIYPTGNIEVKIRTSKYGRYYSEDYYECLNKAIEESIIILNENQTTNVQN